MPFHSIVGPFFRLSDFLLGVADELLAHWWGMPLVIVTAFLLLWRIGEALMTIRVKFLAKQRHAAVQAEMALTEEQLASIRRRQRAAVDDFQVQVDEQIHRSMKSVVNLTEHRRWKGAA